MSGSEPRQQLPLVDLRRHHAALEPQVSAAIKRVFDASAFIQGAEAQAFEREFAAFCGVRHAVACGNGTDALELALWAVGVKPGDEVITVAHTFAATAEAIVRVGAVPRFIDVSSDTLLMDVELIEPAITRRTKAIIPVHLYGSCVDMDALMAIARRHGLKVVEDAAQAHGAMTGGHRAGSIGDAAIFSFYPGKNLGACGDAGAVVTNYSAVADLVAKARDHGRSGKYEHAIVGRNSRMDGLQAAILRLKLPHLEKWNASRRALAARYMTLLEDVPGVSAVATPAGSTAVHHLFVVQCDDRDQVRLRLDASGISTGIHYPIPLHMQPAFAASTNIHHGDLPVTEEAATRIVSLPLFPELTQAEVDRVVDELALAVKGSRSERRPVS